MIGRVKLPPALRKSSPLHQARTKFKLPKRDITSNWCNMDVSCRVMHSHLSCAGKATSSVSSTARVQTKLTPGSTQTTLSSHPFSSSLSQCVAQIASSMAAQPECFGDLKNDHFLQRDKFSGTTPSTTWRYAAIKSFKTHLPRFRQSLGRERVKIPRNLLRSSWVIHLRASHATCIPDMDNPFPP